SCVQATILRYVSDVKQHPLQALIGGPRGALESILPPLAFITTYIATGDNMTLAVSVAVGLGLGVILGIIAGQRNRILDESVSRLFDMLSSFPGVLLAMLIVTFLGQGMLNIAIAVGIAGIPKFGRVVRAQTQLVRDADYVTQATIYGLSQRQVFLRHVLPNVLVAIPIIATVYIGSTILIVSGLSFLGLGPQPPTPEWGVMLAESRDVLRVAWWPGVFPGLAITATVIAFSVVGNFLQKKFEGRMA
ncbi:ABC transporter permease subunit, partial [uncultured Bradyrhizobium sp.]|uniref:ABC transporter permease subunit n=1 Tax=uncultured Bradyrhizobium sp. TaxID=199684 RepID=UPI002635B5C3